MGLTEAVRDMILSALESMEITSAQPTFTNKLIQVNNIDMPDLDKYISSENDKEDLLGNTINEKAKGNFFEKAKDSGIDVDNITKGQAEGILKKAGVNPQDLVRLGLGGGNLMGVLGGIGKAASTAVPPLLIAIMVAEMLPMIIKEIQKPGGFMDKRFKNDVTKEIAGFMDRQTRQNTRIGDRRVIIQQFNGFRNYEGFASSNTQRMVRDNADRVLNVGLFDRAQGV